MMVKKNNILKRTNKKPILWDVFSENSKTKKPLVIFCHGYKGFKDWGAWNIMAETFARAGFIFVKFNFSHNGGTMKQPIDFPDLEAFANNNYTTELDDLQDMIDYLLSNNSSIYSEINTTNITLIGHSRGGGIVAIKAEEETRITKLISLASVCDYADRFPKGEAFKQWKNSGMFHVVNGRTKQEMPHYYQFFEDFKANETRLTIKRAIKNTSIPHLIIHGTHDLGVSYKDAESLHQWNSNSKLYGIENANHVFGASHPWEREELPNDLFKVVESCVNFIKK